MVLFPFNFLATLLSHLALYPEDALVGSIMQYRSKMNTLNVGGDYRRAKSLCILSTDFIPKPHHSMAIFSLVSSQ